MVPREDVEKQVRQVLSQILRETRSRNVPMTDLGEEVDLVHDLGLDSLDATLFAARFNKQNNLALPFQEWYWRQAELGSFRIAELVTFVMEELERAGTPTSSGDGERVEFR